MPYIEVLSQIFGGLGTIGLLIVLVVLWKLGLLKKNGNGKSNGTPQQDINKNFRGDIKELYSHAEKANEEVGKIQIDVALIKQSQKRTEEDIRFIKNNLNGKKN